jgi:hypothetical protein
MPRLSRRTRTSSILCVRSATRRLIPHSLHPHPLRTWLRQSVALYPHFRQRKGIGVETLTYSSARSVRPRCAKSARASASVTRAYRFVFCRAFVMGWVAICLAQQTTKKAQASPNPPFTFLQILFETPIHFRWGGPVLEGGGLPWTYGRGQPPARLRAS